MSLDFASDLFAGLTPAERDDVESRLRAHRFAAGTVILRQGGLSGELHILRSGAAEVLATDPLGHDRTLARLGPGQCFGEMSLLTGQPHSATVRAATPAETLVLMRDDFLHLVDGSAHLAQNLSRLLSQRLYHATRHHAVGKGASVIAVASPFLPAAAPALALNLAISLARQTRRPVLLATDRATLDGPLGPLGAAILPALAEVARDGGAAAHHAAPAGHPALMGVRLCPLGDAGGNWTTGRHWLDNLAELYGYVVLGPAGVADDTFGWAAGASRALLAIPAQHLAAAGTARAIASASGAGLTVDLVATDLPQRPTVAELAALGTPAGGRLAGGLPVTAAALADEPLPPLVRRDRHGAVAAGIDWLARDIAGLKVGLALGAGSARGFAHLGVLRVLERTRVPVDVLTGTSIGAVVAAGFACGHTPDSIAAHMSAAGQRLLSATIPYASLSSNGRLRAALRRLVGEQRIEDLPLPFAAIAVDLATREPVALRDGLLWEALLASAAIPGIFPPVLRDGRLLIDGVVREPLPTRAAASLGGNVIVGVRLAPTNGAGHHGGPPPQRANVFDVVLTMVDVMQEAIESHGSQDAHLIIHPAVAKVSLRQFEAGQALIEAGEAAAEEMLPALSRLLPWLQSERA